jgi:hypothetical protein
VEGYGRKKEGKIILYVYGIYGVIVRTKPGIMVL